MAKWAISTDNNPRTGKADSATVYSDKDLERRQEQAKKDGVDLKVRKL